MAEVEKDLNCLGFFGFGGGWVGAKYGFETGQKLYCNSCPLSQKCWESNGNWIYDPVGPKGWTKYT